MPKKKFLSNEFSNTELAFSYLDNREITRAYWMFKLLNQGILGKFGPKLLSLAFQFNLPLHWVVRPTIFKQFCAGESLEESSELIAKLMSKNVRSILDFASERNSQEHEFSACEKEIINSIDFAAKNPAIAFVVFKTTAMASFALLQACSESSPSLTEAQEVEKKNLDLRIERICAHAAAQQVRIFIDAEESWIQNYIDTLAERMMEKYNQSAKCIVFTTLQMYRKDRLAYLSTLIQRAKEKKFSLGIKLVRGAYMEKERERAREHSYSSPIHPHKAASDRDYNLALRVLFDEINLCSFCVGTHNEESTLLAMELLKSSSIDKKDDRVFFSQLLGMSDTISFNLAHLGYNCAKYMPYGPILSSIPYLLRRAEENSSVHEQSKIQLALYETELKRRKLI